MARTKIDLNGQSDLPVSETNLQRLGDNSLVDDLHRHSELTAPDGSPDPAIWVDDDGLIHIIGNAKLESNSPASDNHLVTVGYVKSRGGKLVSNAWLEMENNYNWPGWDYISSDSKAGKGCLQRTGYLDCIAAELIPVDTTKMYIGSVWFKSTGVGGASRVSAGVACYDKDANNIECRHYYHQENSETTLAQDLENGNTQVVLTGNGTNFAGSGDPSYKRHLGIYDNQYYNENFGDHYYTRNTVHYASIEGNTITLDEPWSGDTIPAGTKVANNQNPSGTYLYSFGQGIYPATTWTNYSGKINGVAGKTETNYDKFRRGTAFVKPIIVAHSGQDDNYTVRMDGFTLRECYSIESHSDIILTAIEDGELLVYDNEKWINKTLAEAGIASSAHTHGQLHTQNTDTGTTQTSFQIDSDNSGHRIKYSANALIVRNAADDGNADFQALNIAATAGLYVGGASGGDLVITSGKVLQNITQATIDNIRIDGANIGHTSDTDLLALAIDKLTINGALELLKGLKLSKETTLAVNSNYAIGECWIHYDSGSGKYYFIFKDEDGSGKGVQLNVDVTLT